MCPRYRPPVLNRDQARPRVALAPTAAVRARLTGPISPVDFALGDQYRGFGPRAPVLNLPVMLDILLAMGWRQIPRSVNCREGWSVNRCAGCPPKA